ncbi:MAG: hypothetical protein GY861_28630 [bacterium]|nr:hypothetical protein [bacterium]
MAVKLNLKKHESKLRFIDEKLYPARDKVNNLLKEAGLRYIETSILWDVVSIIEDYPDTPIAIAHKVIIMYDVAGDQTIFGQLRIAVIQLNELFVEASKNGVSLDARQDLLMLDAMEDMESEEYTGRFGLCILITSPNLEDEIEYTTSEISTE